MSTVVIPVDPTALFSTQTTTLDGVPYLLTFRYNSREQAYYLTIQSADGLTTYVQGVKLVSDFFLLRPYPTPPGELLVLVPDSDDSPPRLGDFAAGGRATLYYLDAPTVFAAGIEPERNPTLS
jgi:uncharacterized protein DUF6983